MSGPTLVSVIVSSYNYGRYLGATIDSALAQTYGPLEVLVVDDGSTDDSRAVIAGYGERIRPILQDNAGQAAAFNTGFARSRGQVVLFLDSDDLLEPGAVAEAVAALARPGVIKVHWPLRIIDGEGRPSGRLVPDHPVPVGDLRPRLAAGWPTGYAWPPTTGNAWSRRFLEQVLPMPTELYRTCPDLYLALVAPAFGELRALPQALGCWRVHGNNSSWRDAADRRLELLLQRLEHAIDRLGRHCREHRIPFSQQAWRDAPWLRYLRSVRDGLAEIEARVPAGASLILVDEDQWDCTGTVGGRRFLPFPELDGCYGGPPADDAAAVRELERLRDEGAGFIAFTEPAAWWLDHYAGLRGHLDACYQRIHQSSLLSIYDLRRNAVRRAG